MGIVVISGAIAAVTALFTAAGRMISTLAEIKTLPGVLLGSAHRNVPATVLLSMTIEGYEKVYALKGGWREWYRAKYPVEGK